VKSAFVRPREWSEEELKELDNHFNVPDDNRPPNLDWIENINLIERMSYESHQPVKTSGVRQMPYVKTWRDALASGEDKEAIEMYGVMFDELMDAGRSSVSLLVTPIVLEEYMNGLDKISKHIRKRTIVSEMSGALPIEDVYKTEEIMLELNYLSMDGLAKETLFF